MQYKWVWIITLVVNCFMLSGCGQSGHLYLPSQPVTPTSSSVGHS